MAKRIRKAAAKPANSTGYLDNYFGLTKNGTDIRTETIAGMI
jgi:hypothetical protein